MEYKMKTNKILAIVLLSIIAIMNFSCSDDNNTTTPTDNINELENLKLVTTLSNDQHKIDLYTVSGNFNTGNNVVYFQIKDNAGNLIKDATCEWIPVMNMMNMKHSCPKSAITKKENAQYTYKGFIVFQMASNDMEYWELTINYNVNGQSYSVSSKIQVKASPKRVSESFMGSDNKKYILALVEPQSPKVGTNNCVAYLYRMENMMSFVPVENYKIMIDPRMPGMGNHSSPNNTDLKHTSNGIYQGNVNLTMTGYWKINLRVANENGDVIKGEEVTESNPASSIYFEIEF